MTRVECITCNGVGLLPGKDRCPLCHGLGNIDSDVRAALLTALSTSPTEATMRENTHQLCDLNEQLRAVRAELAPLLTQLGKGSLLGSLLGKFGGAR